MGSLQEELHSKVAALHQLLSRCSTHSVAGWCFSHLITDQQSKTDNRLTSPDRQISFLLGVLLSSSEPESPVDFTSDNWERAKTLLNEISLAYLQLYFPQERGRKQVTDEWRRIHEVAMLTFLHYFNTGLLASVDQVKDRIAAYVAPFDDDLRSITGIGSSDAAAICQFIASRLQAQLDQLQTTSTDEYVQRQAMLDHASEEKSPDELRGMASKHPWARKASELIEGLRQLGLVNLRDIEAEFPDTADVFWKQFSVSRGEGPALMYPTEQSLFDVRPLILIDDSTAICITGNSLFFAVLTAGGRCLAQSLVKDRFMRARDKALEREVAHCARILLGKGATIWEGVYETPTMNMT